MNDPILQGTVKPLVNAPLLVNTPVRSATDDFVGFSRLTKGGAVRKMLVRLWGNVPTEGATGLFCPHMREDFALQ